MNKTMFFITNDYKKIFIQKPEILNGPVDGSPLMWICHIIKNLWKWKWFLFLFWCIVC